ncbi:UNVERIFIED_ORG: hypothetical protein GGI57_001394 [Rhizobium aethiopicum]
MAKLCQYNSYVEIYFNAANEGHYVRNRFLTEDAGFLSRGFECQYGRG